MKWLFLIIGAIFEVCGAISLKYSQGFTRFVSSIITLVGMTASFHFYVISIKKYFIRNCLCNLD
nr:SMR family transporter [Clostridium puniceum]